MSLYRIAALLALITAWPAESHAQDAVQRKILDVERYHACALTDQGLRCWSQNDIIEWVNYEARTTSYTRPITDYHTPGGSIQVPAFTGTVLTFETTPVQGCAIVEEANRRRHVVCWPIRNGFNRVRLWHDSAQTVEFGHEDLEFLWSPTNADLVYVPPTLNEPLAIEMTTVETCVVDRARGRVCWFCGAPSDEPYCHALRTREVETDHRGKIVSDRERHWLVMEDEVKRKAAAGQAEHDLTPYGAKPDTSWIPAGSIAAAGDLFACALAQGVMDCRMSYRIDYFWHDYQRRWVKTETPSDLEFFHIPEVSPLTALGERLVAIAEGLYPDRARFLMQTAKALERYPVDSADGLAARHFAFNVVSIFLEQCTSEWVQQEVLPKFNRDLERYNEERQYGGVSDFPASDTIRVTALAAVGYALANVKGAIAAESARKKVEELLPVVAEAMTSGEAGALATAVEALAKEEALLVDLAAAKDSAPFGQVLLTLTKYLARP